MHFITKRLQTIFRDELDRSEAMCSFKFTNLQLHQYFLQALNQPMAPTAIAVVPCSFALVPFAKFSYKFEFTS